MAAAATTARLAYQQLLVCIRLPNQSASSGGMWHATQCRPCWPACTCSHEASCSGTTAFPSELCLLSLLTQYTDRLPPCSSYLVVQSSDSWSLQTPDCHVFSVLLRQCPPATLKTLATCILGIAAGILQDPERSAMVDHALPAHATVAHVQL